MPVYLRGLMPVARRNTKPRFSIEEWSLKNPSEQRVSLLAKEFKRHPHPSMELFFNIARSKGFTTTEAIKMWKHATKPK